MDISTALVVLAVVGLIIAFLPDLTKTEADRRKRKVALILGFSLLCVGAATEIGKRVSERRREIATERAADEEHRLLAEAISDLDSLNRSADETLSKLDASARYLPTDTLAGLRVKAHAVRDQLNELDRTVKTGISGLTATAQFKQSVKEAQSSVNRLNAAIDMGTGQSHSVEMPQPDEPLPTRANEIDQGSTNASETARPDGLGPRPPSVQIQPSPDSSTLSAPKPPTYSALIPISAKVPDAFTECEQDECARGSGGAVWVFEGYRGEAMWRSGAVADLTVEEFDNRKIVIVRTDRRNGYMSKSAGPEQFRGRYTGNTNVNGVDGQIVFNGDSRHSGRWHAVVPRQLCDPFEKCPLDVKQMVTLGKTSYRADLHEAALKCFIVAANQGSAEAKSLVAYLLYAQNGSRSKSEEIFRLAKESAVENSGFGELVLAKTYADGIGTAVNPDLAHYWLNKGEVWMKKVTSRSESNISTIPSEADLALLFNAVLDEKENNSADQRQPRDAGPSNVR